MYIFHNYQNYADQKPASKINTWQPSSAKPLQIIFILNEMESKGRE